MFIKSNQLYRNTIAQSIPHNCLGNSAFSIEFNTDHEKKRTFRKTRRQNRKRDTRERMGERQRERGRKTKDTRAPTHTSQTN